MQNNKLKAFLDYLPAIITALIGIATFIVYITAIPGHDVGRSLFVGLAPIFPFFIVFLNRKLNLNIPMYIIILLCLHLVLAADAGTALGAYTRFWWWDLMVHCLFGFYCCGILYYLYIKVAQKKPRALQFIVIALLTISVATIWEMYEFTADLILNTDMQRVNEALLQGISPLTDTMTDIMIAILGALLFYVLLLIKYFATRRKIKNSASDNQI